MYSIDSWVVMGDMLKILEDFHHRSSKRITEMMEKYVADGKWGFPPVVVALTVLEWRI